MISSEHVEIVCVIQKSHLCLSLGPQNRRVAAGESYVVSSDEDDTTPVVNAALMSMQANGSSRYETESC